MSRPLLIILPGWNGSRASWADFMELAKADFDVECVELPCFGSEPEPNEVWGVEEYAAFVKAKIARLKGQKPGQKVILLGHSFGGQVAAYLVGNNEGICDTLILSGPAIFRKKWSLKRLIFWPIAKAGKLFFSIPGLTGFKDVARRILYRSADSPDYAKTNGIVREIFKKVTKQDVSIYLSGIKVPTLIVAGSRDAWVSAKTSARVAGLITGAEFVVVPNGLHGLHRQNPAGLLEIIKKYLASHTS